MKSILIRLSLFIIFVVPFSLILGIREVRAEVYSFNRLAPLDNPPSFIIQYFSYPYGIAVDSSDNIYVADSGNNIIQKLNSSGEWLASYGSAGSGNGQFSYPSAISVDSSGNIYVVDTFNNRIQKLNSSGEWLATYGSQGSGNGQFIQPFGVTLDSSGNIYVVDRGNNRIQKLNSNGEWQATYGSQGSGNGQFQSPNGISIDGSGNIYVADSGNNRIQKLNSSGVWQATYGSQGSDNGLFYQPSGVALDNIGNIYVADSSNNRIQKLNSSGEWLATYGSQGSDNGQFSYPFGVSIDSSGNIYVVDSGNNRIQKLNSSGEWLATYGSEGSGNGQFSYPCGVSIDSSGNIYVADTDNSRIQKLNSSGEWLATYGSEGSGNGQFKSTDSVSVDSIGNVYVADSGNHRIQKLNLFYQINHIDSEYDFVSTQSGESVKLGTASGLIGPTLLSVTRNGVPVLGVLTNITQDVDWSIMGSDVDLTSGKSVVSNVNPIDIPGVAPTHSLYVPKLFGQKIVRVCPEATTLEEVTLDCANGYELDEKSSNVSVVVVSGQSYWLVSGLTGTGGMGLPIQGVPFTLTPNSSVLSTTQEVQMSYVSAGGFLNTEKVRITWDRASLGSAFLNTCTTPTTDANGASTGGDGSASIVGNNMYEYTFSTTTPASTLTFCVNVTATSTQGSYAVSLTDDNGAFSSALYYVGGDNEVFVLANVAPTLSFNIVDVDDTTDKNDCNFGSVTTQTLPPNYDSIIDNDRGECGYALAVGTNAVDGFSTYLISDGALRNSNASITDITTGASFSTGTEAYGLVNVTVGQTGRSTTTGLYTESFTRVSPFTETISGMRMPTSTSELYRYDDGVQYVQGTDSLDVTKVIHGIVVGAGTPAGMYQQILTYTVVPRF